VEIYVRNIAEETRNIQTAIASTERALAGIHSQVKQSSELTISLREEQSQGLAEVHSAVENLTLGVKAQEMEALLQNQRMALPVESARAMLLTGYDSCPPLCRSCLAFEHGGSLQLPGRPSSKGAWHREMAHRSSSVPGFDDWKAPGSVATWDA
jgi:hypothetical protein